MHIHYATANNPNPRAPDLLLRAIILSLAGAVCVGAAWGQTSPNWGSLGNTSPSAQRTEPAASSPGGTGAAVKPVGVPAPPPGAFGSKAAPATSAFGTKAVTAANAPISPAAAPTASEVAQRKAILDALRAGKLPSGWKATKSAPVVSKQRAQMLNESLALRSAARTEAASTLATARKAAAAPVAVPSLTSKAAREPVATAMVKPVAELKPGIFLVNGKHSGVQFTPGGAYVIDGLGFGAALGQVDLVSKQFPGGTLALQVSQWSDSRVQALIPEPIRGLPDQPVTLRVTTRGGTLFPLDAQFVATREEIILHSADGSLPMTSAFTLELSNRADWQNIQTATGIYRNSVGPSLNCPNTGNDMLTPTLPAGWTLSGVTVIGDLPTYSDPKHDMFGQGGDTVVTSNYALVDWQTALTYSRLTIHWGVFRSHTSDTHWAPDADYCLSSYKLDASVVGPAGLKPF